jgi:hypothetical protein
MTIKIEFPADRTDIALAIGQALITIGGGVALSGGPVLKATVELDTSKAIEQIAEATQGASSTACDDWFKTAEQHVADPTPEDKVREESTEVDPKGVTFNAEFCAKAQDPYYASGKRKNQWKKRKGVSEDDYDDWYADELFASKVEDVIPEDSDIVTNTFGNPNQQAAKDESAPQDAGQLMKWVSEQQAAGNISQQQVTDAYAILKLPFDAVMNPAYPIAENCAAIYNHLKGLI